MSEDKLFLKEVDDAAIDDANNQAGLHTVRELEVVTLTGSREGLTWDFARLTRLTVSHTRPASFGSRFDIVLRLPNLVSLGMNMTWVYFLDLDHCTNLETLALNDFYSSHACLALVQASACARLRA